MATTTPPTKCRATDTKSTKTTRSQPHATQVPSNNNSENTQARTAHMEPFDL